MLAIAAIVVAVLVWQVEERQRREEISSLTSNIRVDLDQTSTISRSSTADVESEPWPMTFTIKNFGPSRVEFVKFELHSGSNGVTPGRVIDLKPTGVVRFRDAEDSKLVQGCVYTFEAERWQAGEDISITIEFMVDPKEVPG